jgi:hypothetical protein
VLDPENPDVRRAVFGRQVEHFLESDIGQYLAQCAQADIEEATEKLCRVDPEDPKAIRELQNKIRVAESVMGWLADAIRSGEQSHEALTGNQENEDAQ